MQGGKSAVAALPLLLLMLLLPHHAAHASCPFQHVSGSPPDRPPRMPAQQAAAAGSLPDTGDLVQQCPQAPLASPDASVDFAAVKADIVKLLTDSQAFWPADFGNYGGTFIRMAWHCAGTYRSWDGRGGCDGARQRFEPELSWPDNANLDKTHTLLQPIKLKYGPALSWGDLIVLTGTAAIEAMGGPVLGFCGGRIDDADGTASIPLGPSDIQDQLTPCAVSGNCSGMGQSTMGLIYVDPAGHMGSGAPDAATIEDIRGTFQRMGMNDSETVALIGAHAFGKTHGACPSGPGPSPAQDPYNPYPGTCGSGGDKGKGGNAYTSGFEGPWTESPTRWDNDYFKSLLDFDWVVHTGPGGKPQWRPVAKAGSNRTAPNVMMLTTDIALTKDPAFLEAVKLFANDMAALNTSFAAAWYKLVTRDMGPVTRCIGPFVPPAQPFQNPLPAPAPAQMQPVWDDVRMEIRKLIREDHSGVLPPDGTPRGGAYYGALLSELAWRCASTFRVTDYQGGCNGARIRFSPQKDWPVNVAMDKVLELLRPVQQRFPRVSWADLIVLAGLTAAEDAGGDKAEFCAGRVDALDGGTGMQALAPRTLNNTILLVQDNAVVAGLSTREAVALAGRLRSPSQQRRLGYSGSYNDADPSHLSNDYYIKLLTYNWQPHNSSSGQAEHVASAAADGIPAYMTPADLAIKVQPEMRAVAQEYAGDEQLFRREFAAAWTKLVNADRFDGPTRNLCR